MNYKRFEIENMEWACFIIANRVTERIADELGLKDRNLDGRYDIVIGGTADGVVANVAFKLRYGKIKLQDYQLKMKDFLKEDGNSYGKQIVFCTQKSLSCIKYVKYDKIK